MSDTTSNCAWVCSRCGAFVFGGAGHLCPSQRASTELMSDVQNEILDNLRTIRDQTQQIAQLEAERARLIRALEMIYDKWENGDPCFGDVETLSDPLGNAVRLSYEEENEILALIPRLPSAALAASEQGEPK